ncbi:MAG: hypothetical protein JW953_17875 [Anaerolineae bacterium]|nr:hypothetical protein [Anaerolineae bacterium]
MADFIGNATSNQLLLLMCVPLTGALLLAGFLVFSFSRRRQKAKMKHGFVSKEETYVDLGADEDAPGLPPPPLDDLELVEEPASAPPTAVDLNLAVLRSKVEMEVFDMDAPKQPDEEKIDIAARLGNRPPAGRSAEPTELLRLLRHPRSGQLIVEVAGQRYGRLADIDDRETGQYILELAAHLLAFTGGVIATEVGVKSVYLPKVGETPMSLTAPTPVSQLPDPSAYEPATSSPEPEPSSAKPELVPKPSPEAEVAFLASLKAQSPEPQPRGFLGRSSAASPGASSQLTGFNLADEINKIVQTRLLVSPLASTTAIDILSDPGGGIQIKVNETIYAGPDDIPDPEVKALIKDSIKQWERT